MLRRGDVRVRQPGVPFIDRFLGTTPTGSAGIFDFGDARNPLADYSFVFAPYCTGDVHLGTATHQYSADLTVQHKGSINASTALKALATQFPDATQLVVTGESAGSLPTPLYAGMAHDLLPNSAITVLADGSGAYPGDPAVDAKIGALWGTEAAIPPWPENAGLTAADWGAPSLVRAGRQARPTDHLRSARLRLRLRAADLLRPRRLSPDRSAVGDRRQRDSDRTEWRRSAQLHRARPGAHRAQPSPSFYTETVERRAAWSTGSATSSVASPTPTCTALPARSRCRRPRGGRGGS